MTKKPNRYFVTAIDTDSGKTLVSAILCEALQADYWKPIQAGTPTDSATISQMLSRRELVVHAERYLLNTPASPHAAAKIDNIKIKLDDFETPQTVRPLVIEGAGGCLVPINDTDFVIDLASRLQCELIVVSNLYLGSINHTLLTAEAIKRRNLPVKGIIFNGDANPESQRIISKHTGWKQLLHIGRETAITHEVVAKYAKELLDNWND